MCASQTCGTPSRWRWAEPCRRPSCLRCYRRFVESEIAKAVAHFEDHDPRQLGWLTIHLDASPDLRKLCARTTNRLRNTIDRERRRRSAWEDVEVRALFRSDGERLILHGWVHFGDVAPQEFTRALAQAWSVEAVRVEPFGQRGVEAGIAEFGCRWRTDPETALTSFRSMRLTVGPQWAKATRHWSPITSAPAHLEPLPVSFGYEAVWF